MSNETEKTISNQKRLTGVPIFTRFFYVLQKFADDKSNNGK